MPDPVPPAPDTPTPPGTAPTTFWQSSGAKVAIINTVTLGLLFLHAKILGVPVSPDALNMAADLAVFGWLGAFGIHATDTASLRWK